MKLINQWLTKRREAALLKHEKQTQENQENKKSATDNILKFRESISKAGFTPIYWVNDRYDGDDFLCASGWATFGGSVYYYTVNKGGGADMKKL